MSEYPAINTAAPATHLQIKPSLRPPSPKTGIFQRPAGRLLAISLQSKVNWVSGANLLFPKNPRLAGAYAIHDSTISGCNDRFAPKAVSRNFARGAA